MGSGKPPRSVCRFSRTFGNEVPAIAKMNRIQALLLIAAGIVVAAVVLLSLTAKNAPPAFASAAMIFLAQAPTTLLWLLGALGLGGWAGAFLKREDWNILDRELLLFALGAVSLLWLDSALGALGLSWGTSWPPF